ncbi:MAG: DUF1292 domain-containing protein [Clostridia bacterium]|nr:DUF1292 domain-containing protein [Clostridia bacterium]MBO5092025.1 DUF1292 domain-containing protein [Clostridia bacterium]MBP3494659.1 DUF1292 domain-containing protein [Clostridia bacterium]
MNNDKNFLTFTNDDGTESVYELIDECVVDGSTYVAIAPTEYYVLKKIKSDKKEDLYVPVEGKELDKVFGVFDARINVVDHDKK